MTKDLTDFQDLLARMERLETALSIKIDKFTESEQALAKWRKELTLEVEELKTLKYTLQESLPEVVRESLEETSELIIPQLLPSLIEGFQNKTLAFVESSLKDAEFLKKGIDQTIFQASQIITIREKELTWRMIWITLAACISCLGTAWSIFYLYPQQVTSYGLSPAEAKHMFVGEVVLENFRFLSPQDQSLLKNKMDEKYLTQNKAR